MIVAGTTIVDLAHDGALLIGSRTASPRSCRSAPGFGSASTFLFTGNLTLFLNTTGQFVGSIAGQQVESRRRNVRAHRDHGLALGAQQRHLGDRHVRPHRLQHRARRPRRREALIFGINFNLVADGIIDSNGLVIRAADRRVVPAVRRRGDLGDADVRAQHDEAVPSPVPESRRGRVRVSIPNATLNVFGFKATGSLMITISPGHFRIEVLKATPLSLTVGPLNVGLYGFLDT